MQDIWKSWTELKKICANRKVIFWGRSEDWVPKTLPQFPDGQEIYIVDSNPAYDGSTFMNLDVHLPAVLENEHIDNIYIVITGGVYESIAESLDDLGYTPGKNYCCTPAIRDWGLLQEIREYDRNIIVSCSDYSEKGGKRHSKLGGGIYVCNTRDNVFEKKIGGHFRQVVKVDDHFFVTEFVEKRVYVLSSDFRKVDELLLDQSPGEVEKPNACGIAYHPGKELVFIANAGEDAISVYEKNDFKRVETIHFSNKFEKLGSEQHHINDICTADDSLLACCFSLSGNWKRGIHDGGLLQFDIDDLQKEPETLMRDLWKPHSVQYFDGHVCCLDSMRGDLWIGNRIEGNFPGFARGLTYDGRFYYIGQSEDMYVSRLFGVKQNIMCNAGVYLFDIGNKVSRFFSFPFIMNVHDLIIEE